MKYKHPRARTIQLFRPLVQWGVRFRIENRVEQSSFVEGIDRGSKGSFREMAYGAEAD